MRVQLSGTNYLSLAEVQVFGSTSGFEGNAVAEAIAQQRAKNSRRPEEDFQLIALDGDLKVQRLAAGGRRCAPERLPSAQAPPAASHTYAGY